MKKIIPHVSAFDCRDCLGVRRRKYTADWHTGFAQNSQSNLLYLLGAAGIFLIFMTLIFIGLCKNTTPVSWP